MFNYVAIEQEVRAFRREEPSQSRGLVLMLAARPFWGPSRLYHSGCETSENTPTGMLRYSNLLDRETNSPSAVESGDVMS